MSPPLRLARLTVWPVLTFKTSMEGSMEPAFGAGLAELDPAVVTGAAAVIAEVEPEDLEDGGAVDAVAGEPTSEEDGAAALTAVSDPPHAVTEAARARPSAALAKRVRIATNASRAPGRTLGWPGQLFTTW